MLWCIKNVWRLIIRDITSWILMSGVSWTCRIIRSWSYNSFKMFKSIWNDSKTRVPHKLKPRDIKQYLVMCKQLFQHQKMKDILPHILTNNEKWIHYNNPKYRRSWSKPGHASTSTTKLNILRLKLLLCIWWDQPGVVYYELLKPTETIMGDRNWLQLMCLSQWWRKNNHYVSRDMTKWFCNVTMLGHVLQNGWKPIGNS